ncbi:MAG: GNAT family N-acetyltransferase [Acidimicrobiales bacterium]
MSTSLTRWGAQGLRYGPWRGQAGIAYLAPRLGAPAATVETVTEACARLAGNGFGRVITAALDPSEAEGFLAAGFEVREHLHVLIRGTDDPPVAAEVATRRARRVDRATVLAVDAAAFPTFWRLDEAGLDEALAATPTARFRVGIGDGAEVVAYAIWGRAGRRGYLQRLAVDPARQRAGYGTTLVVDGLRWLHRRGGDSAVVNTQMANQPALALYEHLGFRRRPEGLVVLQADLVP